MYYKNDLYFKTILLKTELLHLILWDFMRPIMCAFWHRPCLKIHPILNIYCLFGTKTDDKIYISIQILNVCLYFLYSNIQHKKCVKFYNLLFYVYQHIKLINNLKGINSLIGNISKINHNLSKNMAWTIIQEVYSSP